MLLQLGSRFSDIPIEVGAPPRDQTKSKCEGNARCRGTIPCDYRSDNRQGGTNRAAQTDTGGVAVESGHALEVDSSEERVILRPVRGSSCIYKQGVWVMHGVAFFEDVVEKTMQHIRREREQSFLGKQR